ncbi:sigma-54-dependent Fis family transcriptional regulator [Lentibacillus amyloliquefaciens]|uniref:sigma-54-dependent Fis family transcriptional regulator n=1 Tax=Lentibacillus amyloliquefaciens TaxID=1472767 RepID=UPI0009E6A767|nr:sigma-54-dependent Fis family transcriptional regulator [Lentibacillus amyloliquefaciens]
MLQDIIQRQDRIIEKEKHLMLKHWMVIEPDYIREHHSIKQAISIFKEFDVEWLPVVNDDMKPVGILTAKSLLESLLLEKENDLLKKSISRDGFIIVSQNDSVLDLHRFPFNYYLVVNSQYKLVGTITRNEILDGISSFIQEIDQLEHTAAILDEVMNIAYEGVAVVDKEGIIVQFNEAYSRFIGVDKEDALGKHVQDVIENTNMHNTVKTGLPERGAIQYIQGQPMIVHRIPIWKNDTVVGAIGMLIFEGVSELYQIYDRIQNDNLKADTNKNIRNVRENHEKIRMTTLDQIIGVSDSTATIKRTARKVAKTDVTVLITGESGTGKGIYASGIHELSPFSSGAFINVNCGAIPENLIESELFGYEEGAFTGAKKGGKQGKFELAQNGTLFLDEIGEMPLTMQTKLLRLLEDKEFERVGGTQKYKVNTRIIAATNRNLWEMVEEGKFREDLFYRLNVVEIQIPPLRERTSDIPSLVSNFMKSMCHKYQVPEKELTSEAMSAFIHYSWKGNVRELINVIERLVVLIDSDTITLNHLPEYMRNSDDVSNNFLSHKGYSDNEKELIQSILNESNGNKTMTARKMGMHRTTLYKKMKKYNL